MVNAQADAQWAEEADSVPAESDAKLEMPGISTGHHAVPKRTVKPGPAIGRRHEQTSYFG